MRALTHVICLAALTACATGPRVRSMPSTPPAELLGAFSDDYGEAHRITADAWRHGEGTVYLVVEWHADSSYVLARNAPTNASAPNRWTRIDWMRLQGMAPYGWAFCLSAYEAPTRAEALAAPVAQRATPRSGCNGFPFSRMKPVAP